jgi:hypothetical protein
MSTAVHMEPKKTLEIYIYIFNLWLNVIKVAIYRLCCMTGMEAAAIALLNMDI